MMEDPRPECKKRRDKEVAVIQEVVSRSQLK
jgi:hypothetical protein